MNEQTNFSSNNLSRIISKSSISNLLSIAQFLDPQSIQTVLQNCQHQKLTNINTFLKIIFVKNFTAKYLHYADRSTYINIYQQQKFIEIQNNQIKNICLNGHQRCKQIQTTILNIKKGLTSELQDLFDVQFALEDLFLSLNDPMPPQLSLRKTNIGTYCNSSFQFYLVQKRFPPKHDFLQGPFAQLKDALNGLKMEYFQQGNGTQELKEDNIKQKIEYLSQCWYKVNGENYQDRLILSQRSYVSRLHNTIVYLMALFDCMIQIVDMYMGILSQDYFHQFIEFSMRFAMFRNSLLELEKQLGFLFDLYNEISKEVDMCDGQNSGIRQKGDITVWRCLLSKWYLYMKKRHDSLNVTYCFLFKKMNYIQLCQGLKDKKIDLSQFMISFQNSLESIEQDIQGHMQLQIQSPLIDYTEDMQLVHQLLKEYVEYMVDISINEDSVHWCGHSNHQMHIPFQVYQKLVVGSMSEYLQKIQKACKQVDNSNSLFVQIINQILNQMDQEYLKPITLKTLIQQINSTWGCLLLQNQIQSNNLLCQQINLDFNQAQSIIKSINFFQRDQRLEHFNLIQKIPSNFDYSCNIVIESEDFNSSLKKSANTNCTQSGEHPNFEEIEVFTGFNKSESINYDS